MPDYCSSGLWIDIENPLPTQPHDMMIEVPEYVDDLTKSLLKIWVKYWENDFDNSPSNDWDVMGEFVIQRLNAYCIDKYVKGWE